VNDVEGNSMSSEMSLFDEPLMTSYWWSVVTVSLSCTVSEILSVISQNFKRSLDHEYMTSGCIPE